MRSINRKKIVEVNHFAILNHILILANQYTSDNNKELKRVSKVIMNPKCIIKFMAVPNNDKKIPRSKIEISNN